MWRSMNSKQACADSCGFFPTRLFIVFKVPFIAGCWLFSNACVQNSAGGILTAHVAFTIMINLARYLQNSFSQSYVSVCIYFNKKFTEKLWSHNIDRLYLRLRTQRVQGPDKEQRFPSMVQWTQWCTISHNIIHSSLLRSKESLMPSLAGFSGYQQLLLSFNLREVNKL